MDEDCRLCELPALVRSRRASDVVVDRRIGFRGGDVGCGRLVDCEEEVCTPLVFADVVEVEAIAADVVDGKESDAAKD